MEFGLITVVLNCLRNADEGVVQSACETLTTLLFGNQRELSVHDLEILSALIEIILKHQGVSLLKHCMIDQGFDVKKAALQVLCLILQG